MYRESDIGLKEELSEKAQQEIFEADADEIAKCLEKLKGANLFDVSFVLTLKGLNGMKKSVTLPILQHDKLPGKYVMSLCAFALQKSSYTKKIVSAVAGDQESFEEDNT